jgi:glycosyltransferase involved in cell wall biosynthesis/ribosomal protein S18 acetylase RimI-like enzyme
VSAPRVAHVTTVDLSLRFLLLAQLRALRDAGFDVTTISAPGPWVPDLEAEGLRHIPWLHATRSWNPREDALAFRELLAIFRRERFDVVHTHNPKPGVMGRIAARIAGVPCVIDTVHGLYATPDDGASRRLPVLAAEWIAARCSHLELYQSAEDLAWARRLGVTRPGRSIHLGNGIDLSRFTPGLAAEERVRKLRSELGIGEDELVVGTVGRMVREKGYLELFEAARIVRSSRSNVRFLVVGDRDADKADAVTEEEVLAAGGDFVFAGWREDVADLIALMDVFALPSWREGMPRSAIEAAASGLPLVLTDIRGCREVVRDGVEGLLVPVRDPRRLAEAILRLLDDPSVRRRMGEAARARAESTFDERRVAATVVEATTSLLASAGRSNASSDGDVRIRPARVTDAATLARLHRASMPTAFLPTLGDRFLRRLYRTMVLDPEAVALVADEGGRVVGFATGVRSVGAFYRRFVRRDGIAAGLAAAPRLVRPSVIKRVIEIARYPSSLDGVPDAELLSIAVDGARRSNGVGSELAGGIARGLAARGVPAFKVVVGADNEGANRFYERLGFASAGATFVHDGTPSNVWVMTCPS